MLAKKMVLNHSTRYLFGRAEWRSDYLECISKVHVRLLQLVQVPIVRVCTSSSSPPFLVNDPMPREQPWPCE